MDFSKDQQGAMDKFIEFMYDPDVHEMVLSGPSGTGKTTLIPEFIKAAHSQTDLVNLISGTHAPKLYIHLTASTNKAAEVLEEKTRIDTTTIHALLGLKVTENFSTGKTSLKRTSNSMVIENTLVFIDEASMINQSLLEIIRELTHKCKVVYIMDHKQLTPVFESDCPVYEQVALKINLTTTHRQQTGNSIIQMGNDLRDALDTGILPQIDSKGANIELLSGPEFKAKIVELYSTDYILNDYKILAWTNDRVRQYNQFVKGLTHNKNEFYVGEILVSNSPAMSHKGQVYFKTDQTFEVLNVTKDTQEGIDGFWVTHIKGHSFVPADYNEVKARLRELAKAKDWPEYFAAKKFFCDFRSVHACTVNKAQGSTYNTAFIDLTDIGRNNKQHEVIRLLYVAITRASHKVYLYGQLPAKYQQAV